MLRFSGHDTFHCKEQWLLKGFQKIDNQGYKAGFGSDSALVDLGVGKNMVRAISHWMKSFDIINEENILTPFANDVFGANGFDPYLENQGTLWLLQYKLCSKNYASIYGLLFCDYFLEKATLEFSEGQIVSYITRKLQESNERIVTETTLVADLKVLLKTYITPKRGDKMNEKTLEDDFSAPLQSLNLIIPLERRAETNEKIYQINRKDIQRGLSVEIFGFCLLIEFQEGDVINLDRLKGTLGAFFCLTNEGLLDAIQGLTEAYSEFVFKEDGGIRQLQIKVENKIELGKKLLTTHYERK
jgi:hypothetical protein